MRILLVQENPAAPCVRTAALEAAGYVVDKVPHAEDAFENLSTYEYDIVVLDRASPEGDGCRVLRRMRSRRVHAPVLMLVPAASNGIVVTALRAGADDVLTYPVADDELLARIESIIRRCNGHARSAVEVGSMVVDIGSHEVTVAGQPMRVTRKELGLLKLLALRRGAVVTRDTIMNSLYDGLNDPSSRTVEVFICILRKKLAQYGADVTIDTVRGAGYILRAAGAQISTPVLVHDTPRCELPQFFAAVAA